MDLQLALQDNSNSSETLSEAESDIDLSDSKLFESELSNPVQGQSSKAEYDGTASIRNQMVAPSKHQDFKMQSAKAISIVVRFNNNLST